MCIMEHRIRIRNLQEMGFIASAVLLRGWLLSRRVSPWFPTTLYQSAEADCVATPSMPLHFSREALDTLVSRLETELSERGGNYPIRVVWGRKLQ